MSGFVFRTVGVNEGTIMEQQRNNQNLMRDRFSFLGGSMSGNEETIMGQ